jgi:hypothetical protein
MEMEMKYRLTSVRAIVGQYSIPGLYNSFASGNARGHREQLGS